MSRDNEVDAARIECIHKDAPHVTDAVLRLLYGLILSVGENVLVHEDDFPWGGGCRRIAFQPGELLLIQGRTARTALEELCIEDNHVHCSEIEGIIVAAKCRAAIFGQGKGLEIPQRQGIRPREAIILVIAEHGDMRNASERGWTPLHRREEAVPMPRGFAVVGEVADECGKIRIAVTPPCCLIEAVPDAVILSTLAVRKEQSVHGRTDCMWSR